MSVLHKLLAVLLFAPAFAFAAAVDVQLDRAPINLRDVDSLQRGARLFVNYCLTCHSANYMRYNRLRDIGLTEQQIRDNLVFTGAKVGELMHVAMDPREARDWFGTPAPDLTLTARSRSTHTASGADWLYTFLRTFYRDPTRPSGWNNLVYPNVGMPHVLWELQGDQVITEGQVWAGGFMKTVPQLSLQRQGFLSPVEYDRAVLDLVNYMTYMSEPARHARQTWGLFVLLGLAVLIALSYALKKEYWKDVH
jgi:ubiquinol-cytochrome c reductase cytochrome c1 subunit